MRRSIFLFVAILLTIIISAQRVPMDHYVYDGWKSPGATSISDDGKWISFEINPEQGHGWLYIYDVNTRTKDSVFYGTNAFFSPDSKYYSIPGKAGK